MWYENILFSHTYKFYCPLTSALRLKFHVLILQTSKKSCQTVSVNQKKDWLDSNDDCVDNQTHCLKRKKRLDIYTDGLFFLSTLHFSCGVTLHSMYYL